MKNWEKQFDKLMDKYDKNTIEAWNNCTRDDLLNFIDKEFVSKAELREKLEEMKKKTYLQQEGQNAYGLLAINCHTDGWNDCLNDIKNLDILK